MSGKRNEKMFIEITRVIIEMGDKCREERGKKIKMQPWKTDTHSATKAESRNKILQQ